MRLLNKVVVAAMAAGALTLAGAGSAFAEAGAWAFSHNPGTVGSGTITNTAWYSPIVTCGLSTASAGAAASDCGDLDAGSHRASTYAGSDNAGSAGSGTNTNTSVVAPVITCGIATAAPGEAFAAC